MKIYHFLLLFTLMTPLGVYAGEGHDHDEDEGHTIIDAHAAKTMNIEVLQATAGSVHQTIGLTGKMTLNQDRVAQIRARFPGIVRRVDKSIGDTVKKGDTMAMVEGNESLQVYAVKAPLDGVILGRNTNVGDVADTEPMFVVADISSLWAEFFIFSRDVGRIAPGQLIDISSLTSDTHTQVTLGNLLPTAESSSQTAVARVVIDNAAHQWRAGMTVRGDVILSERDVPLVVKTEALQRHEGGHVVYVRHDDTYETRMVEIGQSDREWTEILSGLESGELYVAKNSFVVKADIAKSQAEHAH